ncbi:MAG: glycosyltransferase [Pseudomonadota bacterium]|nr:glycosyltransferase [Pseudomonadota bacterium]
MNSARPEDAAATPPARALVSVVMHCYNAAPHIAEAIQSVMGQSYSEVELIVVDDGSTDRSVDIVSQLMREHPGRIRQLFTSRLGPYPARNHGLRSAGGAFVAFLDADNGWLPETLEKLHHALSAGGAEMAYCGWQNLGEGGSLEPNIPPEYEKGDPVESFLRACPCPLHAALLKRSVVDRIGGFSERRYSSMDYDYWLRVLARARNIVLVPEAMAFSRRSGQGQIAVAAWRHVLDTLAAQNDFIRANPRLVAHIPPRRLRELTEGQVLRQAYRTFWKRDLLSAQKLFRHVARQQSFALRDVRHVAAALLPMSLYRRIVKLAERSRL